MSSPTPSAGWYDDPELVGTRRYWDGERWTDHRQEKPASAAPPTPDGGRSSWWKWVGGVVVAIILATVALRVMYGGDSSGGGSSTSYDPDDMANDIELGLIKKGVTVNDLTCSAAGSGSAHQGDVTVCDGTDSDGNDVSVKVTFNSDGSYVWETQ